MTQSPPILASPLRSLSPCVGVSVPEVDSVPFPSSVADASGLVKGPKVGSPPTDSSALHVLEWATPRLNVVQEQEFYDFNTVLDFGAADHVADNSEAPGYKGVDGPESTAR